MTGITSGRWDQLSRARSSRLSSSGQMLNRKRGIDEFCCAMADMEKDSRVRDQARVTLQPLRERDWPADHRGEPDGRDAVDHARRDQKRRGARIARENHWRGEDRREDHPAEKQSERSPGDQKTNKIHSGGKNE